jgi:hypothetical protein
MLHPDTVEIKPKCVIGIMDISNAGAKAIMGHTRRTDELASLSFDHINLVSSSKSAPITLFNDDTATFIAISAKLTEDAKSATKLAASLAQFLSAKQVTEIVLCAAILISFSTKNYFRVHCRRLDESQQAHACPCLSSATSPDQAKCTCLSEFVLNDHLLSALVHFLQLEHIDVTLILTRGNKPTKNTNNEVCFLLSSFHFWSFLFLSFLYSLFLLVAFFLLFIFFA